MENSLQITTTILQDLPEIYALELECFSVPWSFSCLEDEILNPNSKYFTAKLNDKIVGYIGMQQILDEGNINNIAVSPAFQRQGLGGEILKFFIDYAKNSGVATLMLEVRQSNIAATKLYQSFGFKIVGKRKNYYDLPCEDALLMTLLMFN